MKTCLIALGIYLLAISALAAQRTSIDIASNLGAIDIISVYENSENETLLNKSIKVMKN